MYIHKSSGSYLASNNALNLKFKKQYTPISISRNIILVQKRSRFSTITRTNKTFRNISRFASIIQNFRNKKLGFPCFGNIHVVFASIHRLDYVRYCTRPRTQLKHPERIISSAAHEVATHRTDLLQLCGKMVRCRRQIVAHEGHFPLASSCLEWTESLIFVLLHDSLTYLDARRLLLPTRLLEQFKQNLQSFDSCSSISSSERARSCVERPNAPDRKSRYDFIVTTLYTHNFDPTFVPNLLTKLQNWFVC